MVTTDLVKNVVLAHLRGVTSADTGGGPKSTEDKARQTTAVEDLLKGLLKGPLSKWSQKVFAVGGFVRDQLLGYSPKDIDLVVDDPDLQMRSAQVFSAELAKALGIESPGNPHPLKEKYGIWGVVLYSNRPDRQFLANGVDVTGYIIELTPPRKEGDYDAKRSPQSVEYTSIEDDARRRDLTVNAIYQRISDGKVLDFAGGVEDLKAKVLRPPKRAGEDDKAVYKEDPLRIWRLLRFSGKLPGFKVDPETLKTVEDYIRSPEGQHDLKTRLSKERIRDEFSQILTHPDGAQAVQGLTMLKDMGLLDMISPHFRAMNEVYHDNVHHRGESIWQHTMEVLAGTPPSLKARLGALLHDVGKPVAKTEKVDSQGRNRVQFLGHEEHSTEIAQQILSDLKYPLNIIKSVQNIAQSHMGFRDFDTQKTKIKNKRMRIFIEKLHKDMGDALAVIKADSKSNPKNVEMADKLESEILAQIAKDRQSGLFDETKGYASLLNGKDIQEMGIADGKLTGALLWRLKNIALEGRWGGLDDVNKKARAQHEIQTIVQDKSQLAALLKSYEEEKTSKNFFTVR